MTSSAHKFSASLHSSWESGTIVQDHVMFMLADTHFFLHRKSGKKQVISFSAWTINDSCTNTGFYVVVLVRVFGAFFWCWLQMFFIMRLACMFVLIMLIHMMRINIFWLLGKSNMHPRIQRKTKAIAFEYARMKISEWLHLWPLVDSRSESFRLWKVKMCSV